ncbi:MAG: hypothetical protein HIU91_07565 [Acidobacteria bacterium]|nr:hypothetical protein [Acidobacteriota bacterium]
MAIPTRAKSHGTFFITTQTHNRRRLFQHPPTAELLLETLQRYRRAALYKLHAFVVMPDHHDPPEGPGFSRAKSPGPKARTALPKAGVQPQAERPTCLPPRHPSSPLR